MPIVGTSLPKAALRMTDQLAARLRDGVDNLVEPFVVETPIGASRSMHVLVIWDEWSDFDRDLRAKVIEDAYSASRSLNGRRITAAIGVTQEEALRLGFLRYKLIVMRRQADPVPTAELELAYREAGGVVQSVGKTSTRWFPTQAAAEDAYRKVVTRVPGPYWMIVHEVPVETD